MTISIHIYTVLYIYTVINKYMSRSAPSLPPSPPKINRIPALSEFLLHRKADHDGTEISTEQQDTTESGRQGDRGRRGRYHRCQIRCYILNF